MCKPGHDASYSPSYPPSYLTHVRMANVSSTLRIRTKAGIRKQPQIVQGALAKGKAPHLLQDQSMAEVSVFLGILILNLCRSSIPFVPWSRRGQWRSGALEHTVHSDKRQTSQWRCPGLRIPPSLLCCFSLSLLPQVWVQVLRNNGNTRSGVPRPTR